MPAATHNIMIEQGADLDFTVQVWADNDHTVPENLTGWEAKLKIRSSKSDSVAVASLTSNPANGLTVNGPAGQVSVHIAGSVTAGYNWKDSYVYDLKVYNTVDNRYKRVCQGGVTIDPEVSW